MNLLTTKYNGFYSDLIKKTFFPFPSLQEGFQDGFQESDCEGMNKTQWLFRRLL